MADITDNLDDMDRIAEEPRSASGDSGSVTKHSLQEQMAYDRHRQAKLATKAKGLPFKMLKLVPPGGNE